MNVSLFLYILFIGDEKLEKLTTLKAIIPEFELINGLNMCSETK